MDPFIPPSIRHLHTPQSAIYSKTPLLIPPFGAFYELLISARREKLINHRVLYLGEKSDGRGKGRAKGAL